MSSLLAIVGAGGFGRETRALLSELSRSKDDWTFVGFVSSDQPDESLLARIDARWIGDDESFLANPIATHYVVAVSDPVTRERLAARYDAAGLKAATLVHPSASIGPDVLLGAGSIVCAQASLTTNITVGRHVHIDRVVTIGHDAVIEDFVTLHPAGVVSGAVRIGTRARMGTNASVLQGLRLGADAVIGAGSVVTRDVAEGSTVLGVPARPVPPTRGGVE